MYALAYEYIHTYPHIRMYICMYVCMNELMYVCMHILSLPFGVGNSSRYFGVIDHTTSGRILQWGHHVSGQVNATCQNT